jgi:superfamily II DNA/RNA helicase
MESKLDNNTGILDLLVENGYDGDLQKALMRMKFLHPTIIQTELLGLLNKKRKIVVNYSVQSGKSTGAALLLSQLFIQHLQSTSEARQEKLKADTSAVAAEFGIYLCSSRDICEKNAKIFENILFYAKNQHNIHVKNLSFYENSNSYNLLPKENYIIIATPAQFLKFFKSLKLDSLEFYQFLAFDDVDYQVSFGYEKDILEISQTFATRVEGLLAVIFLSSQGLSEEITTLRKHFIPKAAILKNEEQADDDSEEENEDPQGDLNQQRLANITQMYYIGEELTKFIVLYLGFKVIFYKCFLYRVYFF